MRSGNGLASFVSLPTICRASHHRLRTLFDLQRDGQVVLLALIVVFHLGRDFHVQKTVGAIRVGDEVANVRVEQRLAVTAMRQKASGGLDLHPRSNLLLAETLVARDRQLQQLVPVAGVDVVGDPHLAGRSRVLLHRDFGVEVAQALHVIEQIAPAFVQQVIVERIFFVDRDVLLELASG